MSHKTKQILLIALLSLLITALFAASFTYARYYKETGVTGGKYDDTIEFVGANKYIVYSPEELVSAIENGYSYIEIGEDAEEPFVITDGVTDVSANLVLDINGHNLVRNSRNPLIDVQENVSVVIVYDSENSGSFYNPVGSMLQASGGTLTIATGEFTSGPKAEDVAEYAASSDGYWYNSTKDVFFYDSELNSADITLFSRSNRAADGYTKVTDTVSMPKIGKDVYFPIDEQDEDSALPGALTNNSYIKEDTFLIYTEETVETPKGTTVNVDFEPLCDVASCDFYYYYEKSTEGSGDEQTTIYAVVYGYHDVMKGAEQQITTTGFNTSGSINNNSAKAVIWPYATVRMTQGEAFIRGGSYINRFGNAYSYGIYARGGSLSVQGESTSFTSVEDGVCIRCTTEDGAAPSLHIENGSFTSYNGDTVQVNGGTMTVESGTFTKSGAGADDVKTAIIHMENGILEAKGSTDANGKKSIQMTCAASAGGSTLSNVFGVYSEGGTVSLQNTQINVNGTYSAGVLAVTDGQAMSADQYAVTVVDSAIEVNFNESDLSSSSISTEGGNIQLEGAVSVFSRGLGITARKGSINIESGTASVKTPRGTGVYVNNGTLTVNEDASLSVKPTMSENSWVNPPEVSGDVVTHYDGVVVEGGSLVSNGTLNVEFTGLTNTGHDQYDDLNIRSYAVRVLNAETVTISGGTITNYVGGGVYVGGGTVTLGDETTKKGPTVTTTGTSVGGYVDPWSDSTWSYYKNVGGGSAVSVEGGELTIYGGTYTAALGDGIFVNNGTATVEGGSFVGKGGATAGAAANYGFKMYGGTVNISGGTFGNSDGNSSGAFVMGKSSKDKATISGGTFVVGGATAFSVWQSANVEFSNVNTLTVQGASTGLAIETKTEEGTQAQVTVNGGKFTGNTSGNTQSGIWYGNRTSKLTVTGGTFTGGTAGLYFGAEPGVTEVEPGVTEENVQLSGGTFYGPKNDVRLFHSWGIPQPSNNANYNAIDGQDIDYSRILLAGYSANGDTQYDGRVNSGSETAEGTYTTTKVLTRLKERGEVEVERYGPWYTTHLVFSKITVQ